MLGLLSISENPQWSRVLKFLLFVVVFSLISFGVVTWFNKHYVLGVNITKSLPGTIYIIAKDEFPARGDFVGFYYHGHLDNYPEGTMFIKIMVGTPGDMAWVDDNGKCLEYHVNDVALGCIQERSSRGDILEVGPVGVIPAGYYAVQGLHELSFDSRYGQLGWIPVESTIGKAYRVF